MRRDQLEFFAVLDAVAEDSRGRSGLTAAAFAGGSVDTAPVFAELAIAVMRVSKTEPIVLDPRGLTHIRGDGMKATAFRAITCPPSTYGAETSSYGGLNVGGAG